MYGLPEAAAAAAAAAAVQNQAIHVEREINKDRLRKGTPQGERGYGRTIRSRLWSLSAPEDSIDPVSWVV